MSKLISILASSLLTLTSLAEPKISEFSYDSRTQKVRIVTDCPSNQTYKLEYKPTLTSTNWTSYATIIKGGIQTNTFYSPVDSRFFRLKQR